MKKLEKLMEEIIPDERAKIKIAIEFIKNAGVTKIIASYNGSCDDGCIEDVTALGINVKIDIPDKYRRDLGLLFTVVLENTVMGWENNEGGYGDIEIDLIKLEAVVYHSERIEKIRESTHRL